MKIEKYVRKHILDIAPYGLGADFPKDLKKLSRMSLNENLFIDRNEVMSLLEKALRDLDPRIYPEPHGGAAVKAISDFLGIEESKIFIGNGLDDVLDRVSRVFINEGTKVGILEPSFLIYSYYVELYNGVKLPILLKENFELDVEAILRTCKNKAKLLFICSPNSPTGNQFKAEEIREILSNFDDLVIIDETYVDFGDYSVYKWINDFDNLLVLRSFSKAYGLAGVRIGYLLANEEIVKVLKKSVHPFNVNSVAQQVAVLVLRKYDYFKEKIENLKIERNRLIEKLESIDGLKVYPSNANFILFRINKREVKSSEVRARLIEKGIIVKDRGHIPLLDNCLRVTIATRELNDKFIYILRNILKNEN